MADDAALQKGRPTIRLSDKMDDYIFIRTVRFIQCYVMLPSLSLCSPNYVIFEYDE